MKEENVTEVNEKQKADRFKTREDCEREIAVSEQTSRIDESAEKFSDEDSKNEMAKVKEEEQVKNQRRGGGKGRGEG